MEESQRVKTPSLIHRTMSNWGSFSEESYLDFMHQLGSPVDYMVVAPALASRAAFSPSSYMMDEGEEGEEEMDMEDWEDEEEQEDQESNARMAMGQLRSMAEDIMLILSEMHPDENLEPWVASKITMSKQNLSAVADYLRFND